MSPHRFFCRPRLRRPLTSAVIILFMRFRPLCSSTTVPFRSGLSYFVSNACNPQHLSDDPSNFLSFSQTPTIHSSILISVLSSALPLSLSLSRSLLHTTAPVKSLSCIHFLLDILISWHHKTPAEVHYINPYSLPPDKWRH